MELELTSHEFELFRKFIYEKMGITLGQSKISLVKGRLQKRVRALGLSSFSEYYHYLQEGDPLELGEFATAISTNVTSFFREPKQWEFLEKNLSMILQKKKHKLRIWSAGCSSGEEPYSLMLFLENHIPDFKNWDIKILATDISHKALSHAISATYSAASVENSMPKKWIHEGFVVSKENGHIYYTIRPHLQAPIIFRTFNLISDPFIIKKPFDLIFCRNVMIYFDDRTRMGLYKKISSVLDPEGYFFIGSSEAILDKDAPFELIGSSIYRHKLPKRTM